MPEKLTLNESRTPRGHTLRIALAGLAMVAIGALFACESPLAMQADHDAYKLTDQRQEQSLGYPSDDLLRGTMPPVAIAPEAYGKVPPTNNRLPDSQPAPESRFGPSQSTQPTTLGSNPMESVMAAIGTMPAMNLDRMPELPEFPRTPPKGQTRLFFALDDCFNYSLAHSRDYVTQKEDLYITALNVTLERHRFEPRFFANTTVGIASNAENSDYSAAFNAAQTVGVKQKLPYGGEIIASGIVQTVNQIKQTVNDDTGSADLILQANIPLLRGAGIVAQESLIQSERNLIYQVRDFERYRRSFLVQIATAYYSLINQRTQVLNRFQSVRSYIFITERTEALFKAGRPRVSLLDVQRAQQSEFQARNDLINAIAQYELAVDGFKLLIGMPAQQPLDVTPQYLKITPPNITDADAVAIANRLRLDLQTTRDQVDDARRQSKVAGNNLLPDVNLTGIADMSTNPSTRVYGPDPRNGNYSAGVSVDWPLDRVGERNAYRISLINIDRARRNVDQSQDQVAIDVRSSLRNVRQQIYLVALQKKNIELAQNRKEFSDIQFQNGKIDNRDYLDAENALVDAQNRFAQAVSGLQIATMQYLRDTDQLRVSFNGKLVPPDEAAGVKVREILPGATQPASQPATQP